MSTLRHRLFDDSGTKMMVAVVSITLWFGVHASQLMIAQFTSPIPVHVDNLPSGTVAQLGQQEVQAVLAAPPNVWQAVKVEDLRASVDAARTDGQNQELTVRVSSSLPGIRVLSVKPARVLVRMEPLVQKSVPVSIAYEGTMQTGLSAASGSSSPSEVLLLGPKSALDQVETVAAPINLTGQKTSFTTSVPLRILAAEVNTNGVHVEPATASVTVPIERAESTKTVAVTVKVAGSPPSGFQVTGLSATPNTITVTGAKDDLATLTSLETKPIQLGELREPSTVAADLVVPTGLRLVDPAASSVLVAVSVSTETSLNR